MSPLGSPTRPTFGRLWPLHLRRGRMPHICGQTFMAGKIFITYRGDDSAAEALNIAQYLENTFGKSNIFIDIDRLRAGQKFATVLEELGQCKVMLAIIGPKWLDVRDKKGSRRLDDPEDWVRLEIERSLARNIPVIPVLVAGATLPSKRDLPLSLHPLVGYQYATVTTNGFRYEMGGLARDVAELTVRRPWGRMAAAASGLILGGYVAGYQFGAPVWSPSFFGQDRSTVVPTPPAPDAPRPLPNAPEAPKRPEYAAGDPSPSATPGSGKSFQDRLADGNPCPICPEMAVAPAGTFTMGSPPSEPERFPEEVQVRVAIAQPFAVGKFAVTFDQWDACVAGGGCKGYRPADQGWGRGNRPVINVDWDDATTYVTWLSRKTGKTFRLLSEAEREYVTRAGTRTPFWWGPAITPKQANYNGSVEPYKGGGTKGEYRRKTVAVDNFEANPWGLFNVHGNVWEWTEDCWNDSNQGNPGDGSPRTMGDCGRRVVRGGSWSYNPQVLRSADRSWVSTVIRYDDVGFRLARTLNP
jgi:formylglycine-generating enzyme required for sulfatase activity